MNPPETFGRYLINQGMPEGHKFTGAISKKSLTKAMSGLAHKEPKVYVESIMHLKHLGDSLATKEGLTVGLDDIEPDYKERDRIYQPHIDKFNRAQTDEQRREIVERAHPDMIGHALKHSGSLAMQVQSGSRGNSVQLAKTVSTPVYARDSKGRTEPWLIHRSYSEGLKPSDYWVAGNEALHDVIKTYTLSSEPGELSKILVSNLSDIIITEEDCGTQNGILMDPSSPDMADRYLARDAGVFKRGTLVTPDVQNKLMRSAKKVTVRSPMTCEAGDGVCQKCQGLDEKGHIHQPGTNVGIRAAQAITEPLTQFVISSKHGALTSKTERLQVHGVQGLRQITESPAQFINKATLATQDGRITKIEAAPHGGHYVHIGEERHYVTPNLDVSVKMGDKIEKGDVLSTGLPKPDEVVKYKGLSAGRLYVVNALKDLFKAQGFDHDQRHFEILARGELDHVRVLNDPSNRFLKGDVVSYNHLRSIIGKDAKTVPVNDALGEHLGKEYYHFSMGTSVTPSVAAFLKKQNIQEVFVAPHAPEVEFIMKPATRAPLLHPDWMGRLAHRNLKVTLQQAAHVGDVSDIHGTHPVPAYAFGAEFGKGEKGRY